MTNPKDHDPRTDRPETADDTEGHMPRIRYHGAGAKAMPTDDTQTDTTDDDTEGHGSRFNF